MILIFVESPSKAKAINEYLKGEKDQYLVLATVGHVRNLAKKSGSIEVDNDFKYIWDYTAQWIKNKQKILSEAKKADRIIIASDPDREGEAIAWHLNEILKQNKIVCPVKRMVFHSISKKSILEALKDPIDIRQGLVNAYLARVGLDYLFGYSISPLLWRKVPCCKSAGRVQSVGLKLLVEKENEILKFKKEKYITIHSKFREFNGEALLTSFNGVEFKNGSIFDMTLVDVENLKNCVFRVDQVAKTQIKQNPPAPLITSKLQQLASSILNFSPAKTMQLAQKLYEGFTVNGKHMGLITYMRTDSFHIEKAAIDQIRSKLLERYGEKYLSKTVLTYSKSVKNAQEAHEAIRPIDINLTADDIVFPDEQLKALYHLIWTRTLATQCAQALLDKTNIKITTKDAKENHYLFEVNDTFVAFPSFKTIIQSEDKEESVNLDLSDLAQGKELSCLGVDKKDHETQPPKRYSEASFINQLEKLGIGRPSTYSHISSVLLEREYISQNKKIISPTQKGWVVTSFLESFFNEEVTYDFTSQMESQLDDIANNNEDYKVMLKKFWSHLDGLISQVEDKISPVVFETIENVYPEFYCSHNKKCDCGGNLTLKITKFGAIRGCSNYPACNKMFQLATEDKNVDPSFLGVTDNNEKIFLKKGPYGMYLEIEQESLKRISIPKFMYKDREVTLQDALCLLALPKSLGEFEDSTILLNNGRYGPYLQWKKVLVSISTFTIELEDAIKKVQKKREGLKKD